LTSIGQKPKKNRIKDTRKLTETQASGPAKDILSRIVDSKGVEVANLRGRESELLAATDSARPPRDFTSALRRSGEVALIAEAKRRSPGAGPIRPGLDTVELARAYEEAGVSAMSVLTDQEYFGGRLADLTQVREVVEIPVLRKDFLLEEIQIVEARAAGADAVLLIVRILDDERLKGLRERAEDLGMTALVETHDRDEVERALKSGTSVLGINNRNLSTFETRIDVTLEMAREVPPSVVLVSESGIRTATDVERLGQAGVDAILVGEALLREDDPGEAASRLVGLARTDRSHG
jgi:indole-3-glycerol phosphate synthase